MSSALRPMWRLATLNCRFRPDATDKHAAIKSLNDVIFEKSLWRRSVTPQTGSRQH